MVCLKNWLIFLEAALALLRVIMPLRVPLRMGLLRMGLLRVPLRMPLRVPLRMPLRVPLRVPLRMPLRMPLRFVLYGLEGFVFVLEGLVLLYLVLVRRLSNKGLSAFLFLKPSIYIYYSFIFLVPALVSVLPH